MTEQLPPVVAVDDRPVRRRTQRNRGRLPLRIMTGTQAKIVGGAIGGLITFLWNGTVLYLGGTKDHPFYLNEVIAGAISVLMVSLVDLTLGGKPRQVEEPAE